MPRNHKIKCPICSHSAGRIHRYLSDHLIGIFKTNKRYRCFNPDCKWEGLQYEQRAIFAPRTAIRQLKRRRVIQGLVIIGSATLVGITLTKMFTSSSDSNNNTAPRKYD